MKKIRLISVILFLLATAAYTAFSLYERIQRDAEPPVVHCPEDVLQVSVSAGEEELLRDVTAEDGRDGDVSGSLVVEHISDLTEAGERTVIYAAIDAAGNVGRSRRPLRYTDYKKPEFSLTGPLRFPMGEAIDFSGLLEAESVLDGDISTKIKYSLESTVDSKSPGMWNAYVRVADSAGQTVEILLPIEVYDRSAEAIDVELQTYLIYVPLHTSFDPLQYYAGADMPGDLNIQSNVNTSQAGTYYVDYIVTNNTRSGKSRMIVIVE